MPIFLGKKNMKSLIMKRFQRKKIKIIILAINAEYLNNKEIFLMP